MKERVNLNDYRLGQWIPELGKYKKRCALKECGAYFAGRKNKDYCCEACKKKKNNDLASFRRELSQRFLSATINANKAFHQCLTIEDGINEVTKTRLLKNGFVGDAPTKRMKDDRFHGEWWSVGSFAYREKRNDSTIIEFIQIKNEDLWL